MVGEGVRAQQQRRLRNDMRDLLAADWGRLKGMRVITEKTFGYPAPAQLRIGTKVLYVHGRIDRIEITGSKTIIRDLKTARAHPRTGKEAEASPALDVQIAVYGLIAELLAREWQLPHHIEAGYAYFGRPSGERLFGADFQTALKPVASKWLETSADLLREQAVRNNESTSDERVKRAQAARVLVRELRQQRFDRSPGTTARELLDRTAFARAVALGSNGAQRLVRLRELCHILETISVEERLDYDGVTARLREWIDDPIQLDPPHPVGAEAVQVLTVHQAKGLEFPVVAIWDGRGQWDARLQPSPWRMERDGRGWMINLDRLTWEEPAALGIRNAEQRYLDAERKRIAYVAATRARDLVIVPKAGTVAPGKFICGDLLVDSPEQLIHTMEPYIDGEEPAWARQMKAVSRSIPGDGSELEAQVLDQWARVSVEAARPRFRPVSVSVLSGNSPRPENDETIEALPVNDREGRYGGIFGSTVHHALGIMLRGSGKSVQQAVERGARLYGLTEHLEEAIADVTRAVEGLKSAGLARPPGTDLQLEYPVAGPWSDGQLASGYIDLVAVENDRVEVIDFKTDRLPPGPVEQTYPKYAAQVRIYGKLLEATGILKNRRLRCGLLFTADGAIRWIDL